MSQLVTKVVLLQMMFLVGVITVCAETCPENQYLLPESQLCCVICPAGTYVERNCSKGPGSSYNGVQCMQCSRCEDSGLRTVSQCTLFLDTQCDANDSVLKNSYSKLQQFTIFGCLSAAAAVVVLAVIVSACFFRRTGKSGGSDDSSAEESFI